MTLKKVAIIMCAVLSVLAVVSNRRGWEVKAAFKAIPSKCRFKCGGGQSGDSESSTRSQPA